jgi:methylmalonyl-CoA mutase N-terminal domain/subunit
VAAIESRFMQRAIEAAAWAEQQEIESGERVIVGLNRHTESVAGAGLGTQGTLFRLDEAAAAAQRQGLEALRRERDAAAVEAALASLRDAARAPEADLMDPILAAVRAYATAGEISGALRDIFGTHRDSA